MQKLQKLGNYSLKYGIPKMAKIAGYESLLNIFEKVATVVILEWFAKLLQKSLVLASIAKKCLQEYPKKQNNVPLQNQKKKKKKISVNRNIARKNNKNSIEKETHLLYWTINLLISQYGQNQSE